MKTIVTLFTWMVLALPGVAQQQMKPLDKDIPLADAIQQANTFFTEIQPVTEEEIVAAVKAIKLLHPDIKTNVYQIYSRIVTDRVWPKGIYFSRITNWNTQYGMTHVDWLDICLASTEPLTPEEQKEALASLQKGFGFVIKDPGNMKKGGYAYRIRSRFVSSSPAIDLIQPGKEISWQGGTTLHVTRRDGDSLEGIQVVSTSDDGRKTTVTADTGTVSSGSIEDAADMNSVKLTLRDPHGFTVAPTGNMVTTGKEMVLVLKR